MRKFPESHIFDKKKTMTRIYCTHKLQRFIGKGVQDLPVDLVDSKYGDWNGNLFFIKKRKYIVLTNNLTNYSIFLPNILKKDLKEFNNLIERRVIEQLIYDKIINQNDIEFIREFIGQLTFYKTNNDRRILGVMNDIIYNFKANCLYKYNHISEMDIIHENGILNTMPTMKPRILKKKLSVAIDNLKELKNQRTTTAHRQ